MKFSVVYHENFTESITENFNSVMFEVVTYQKNFYHRKVIIYYSFLIWVKNHLWYYLCIRLRHLFLSYGKVLIEFLVDKIATNSKIIEVLDLIWKKIKL